MPIYSPTGFLDVTNATLRTSNLEAENFKLNGGNIYVSTEFTVAPTLQLITNSSPVTSNTIEFTNPTTAFTTTGNVEVGKELSVTGNVAVDTDTLFVDSANDRVGIGTVTPGATFQIGEPSQYPYPIPIPAWAKTIPGSSTDYGNGIVTDSSGNVYVTGQYNSTSIVPLGNTLNLPASSGEDGFIVKYDTSGLAQWYQTIPGTENDNGYGIAVDSSGNVYVSGYYWSTSIVSLNNDIELPASSIYDGFIVKYDTSGLAQWFQTISGSSIDIGLGIAVDSSGNVFVTGQYNSTSIVPLGNTLNLPASSGEDGFIVKYDTSGLAQWYQTIPGTENDNGYGIAVDSSGNVYVTGKYSSTSIVPLGNTLNLPASNGLDAFIVKYDTSGTAQWAQTIGGSSSDIATGIAVDSSGNVFVTGYYSSANISLGNSLSLPASSVYDGFIVKYDTSGLAQWAQTISGTASDIANGISVDSGGNVYVTGGYSSTSIVPLGNNLNLPASNGGDGFIVKYDTSGLAQWYKTITGTGSDYGNGIAVDSGGNVYVTGGYSSTSIVPLGNSLNLPASSGEDAFVIKYSNFPTATPDTSLFVTGNVQIGDSKLFVDTTAGNVGIGTTSPANTMHIYKNANEQTTGLLISKDNAGSGAAAIFFDVTSSAASETVNVPKAAILFERELTKGRGSLQFCVDTVDDNNPVTSSDAALIITSEGYVQPGQINLTLTGAEKALGGNYLFQGVYDAYRVNGYVNTSWSGVFQHWIQVFRMGSLISIRGYLPIRLTSSTMNLQFTWAELGIDGQRTDLKTLVNQCTASSGTWNNATSSTSYLTLPSTGHTGNGTVDYQNLVYLIDVGWMNSY